MANKAYLEKLRDPRWQKKRLEVFERDKWSCQVCCDMDSTLHLHHKYYLENFEPWDYDNKALITLCEKCHQDWHFFKPINEFHLLRSLYDAGFSIYDFVDIGMGFHYLKTNYHSEQNASIIRWMLSNEQIYAKIEELYFKENPQTPLSNGPDQDN